MPTQKHTQSQLKQAYTIVTEHLSQQLLKAKENESIRLGSLGAFKKSECQMTSHLEKAYGETYVYYRINFKPFSKLKQALNNALEKKYRK